MDYDWADFDVIIDEGYDGGGVSGRYGCGVGAPKAKRGMVPRGKEDRSTENSLALQAMARKHSSQRKTSEERLGGARVRKGPYRGSAL
jgi:hypothetical protein